MPERKTRDISGQSGHGFWLISREFVVIMFISFEDFIGSIAHELFIDHRSHLSGHKLTYTSSDKGKKNVLTIPLRLHVCDGCTWCKFI